MKKKGRESMKQTEKENSDGGISWGMRSGTQEMILH